MSEEVSFIDRDDSSATWMEQGRKKNKEEKLLEGYIWLDARSHERWWSLYDPSIFYEMGEKKR